MFNEFIIAKYDFGNQDGYLLALLKRSTWLDFYILRKCDSHTSNDLLISKNQNELIERYNSYLKSYNDQTDVS